MIEGGEGAKAMSPGWWFDWAEGVGVGVVVSCAHCVKIPVCISKLEHLCISHKTMNLVSLANLYRDRLGNTRYW